MKPGIIFPARPKYLPKSRLRNRLKSKEVSLIDRTSFSLREIIKVSDGIMICRSNLAMNYAPEKIFKLQKYIIGHCNIAEKPVFLEGQLVESMIAKPRPTRAEVSDIANAVLDGVDGLILTIETSWGSFPFETVDVVDNVS